MRAPLVAGIATLFLWSADAAAAPCKVGETVTLRGEVIIPPVVDGAEWFWPGKFAQTPCRVMTLRGEGALPSGCVPGKRMALTGLVTENGVLMLRVTSIRCY